MGSSAFFCDDFKEPDISSNLRIFTVYNTEDAEKIIAYKKTYFRDNSLVVTHSGRFHNDEVLASVLLDLNPNFKEFKLVRTRIPSLINNADLVVDVGGIYDPQKFRFDHHQASFQVTFNEDYKISKLSSAGLIFKHFGKEILQYKFGVIDEEKLNWLYLQLYEDFFHSIDALDNGISVCGKNEMLFKITTDLGARVSRLNPQWNESSDFLESNRFQNAMEIVKEELLAQIHEKLEVIWPSRLIVQNAIKSRFDFHPSGKIILLPIRCPYLNALHEVELEASKESNSFQILFVVYPENKTTHWIVEAIGNKGNFFQHRILLPAVLRGYRNEELAEKAAPLGLDNLVFVHAGGYMGVTKSKESALILALKSLNM